MLNYLTKKITETAYGTQKQQTTGEPTTPRSEPTTPRKDETPSIFPETKSLKGRMWDAFVPFIPAVTIGIGAIGNQFYTIVNVLPINPYTKFFVAGLGFYGLTKGTSDVFEGAVTIGKVGKKVLYDKKRDDKTSEQLLHGVSKITNGTLEFLAGYGCLKTFQAMEAVQTIPQTECKQEKWTSEMCNKEYPVTLPECKPQVITKEIVLEVPQEITAEQCTTKFPPQKWTFEQCKAEYPDQPTVETKGFFG